MVSSAGQEVTQTAAGASTWPYGALGLDTVRALDTHPRDGGLSVREALCGTAACVRRTHCLTLCFCLGERHRRETPQEQVRRWQRVIRGEMRAVDRQITGAHRVARVGTRGHTALRACCAS